MTERTKNILVIIAALVLLFAFALYQGIATVPGEVQAAAWGLLIAAIGALSVYLNTRSNAATRANSDKNAYETQAKIETLHSTVAAQADVVAAKVAEVTTSAPLAAIEQHTAEIAENTERLAP